MIRNFGGFSEEGQWFKGNLHCHTSRSDARETPEQTVEFYKSNGYSFLAITDHTKKIGEGEVPSHPHAELSSNSFLVLPGAEYDWWAPGLVHIVVVGPGYDQQPEVAGKVDLSATMKKWWDGGAFTWWAHPYWSHNGTETINRMSFLPAFEVYNSVCEVETAKGLSVVHWDCGLGHHRPMLAIAVDDTHSLERHAAGGWVVVKAKELTQEALLESLRNGNFYASSGPVIEDIYFEDEEETKLRVKCSPAKAIKLITANGRGKVERAAPGETFTDTVVTWNWTVWGSKCPYLRVEVTDAEGRSAWAQAVYCD